jgi:hypothetical protein
MAGKIFANYRRGDNAGITQGLYHGLEDEFTAGVLFHGCGGERHTRSNQMSYVGSAC